MMKKTYKIDVDCANCANLMEAAANKVAGVEWAAVRFMMQKMVVEWARGGAREAVMPEVVKACKIVDDGEIFL